MRSIERLMSSLPPNTTDPVRLPTMPMIAFIVVVLPAPLRPSRVTTSPSRTSKSTPCKMWLSPYQAFRLLTSSIAGSQVGRDHLGVLRDRGIVALSQHLPAGQHGDDVAQPLHHRQVVLHHQDGAA